MLTENIWSRIQAAQTEAGMTSHAPSSERLFLGSRGWWLHPETSMFPPEDLQEHSLAFMKARTVLALANVGQKPLKSHQFGALVELPPWDQSLKIKWHEVCTAINNEQSLVSDVCWRVVEQKGSCRRLLYGVLSAPVSAALDIYVQTHAQDVLYFSEVCHDLMRAPTGT